MEPRCQCPTRGQVSDAMLSRYAPEEKAGMNHEPGKCKGTYDLRQYRRGSSFLWLCSCCCLPGDIPFEEMS